LDKADSENRKVADEVLAKEMADVEELGKQFNAVHEKLNEFYLKEQKASLDVKEVQDSVRILNDKIKTLTKLES
jgi:2-hydroxy-3-keto-5-methylthiopentenyl-1-phosphate phosphatase